MDLEKLNLKQDKTQQPRLGNEGEETAIQMKSLHLCSVALLSIFSSPVQGLLALNLAETEG